MVLALTDLVLISLILGIPGVAIVAIAVGLVISRRRAAIRNEVLLPPAASAPGSPPPAAEAGEWRSDADGPPET